MPGSRGKNRHKKKNRHGEKGNSTQNVIVISESDDDNDDVNDQVEHLHISPRSRTVSNSSMNPPAWGAGLPVSQGPKPSSSRSSSGDRDCNFLMLTEHDRHRPKGSRSSSRNREDTQSPKLANSSQQSPLLAGFPQQSPILAGFHQQSPILAANSQQFPNLSGHSQPRPPSLSGFLPLSNPLMNLRGMALPNAMSHQSLMSSQPMTPIDVQTPSRHVPDLLQQMTPNNSPFISGMLPQTSVQQSSSLSVTPVHPSDPEFPKATVKSGRPPGTKIVKDTQPVSIRKHHATGGRLSFDEVNASIQECIEILSQAGHHVSLERLDAMIVEKYQVRHFSQLNLNIKNFTQMPAASEHSRLLSKVNAYVHSFVRARSMCTLYELGECMRDFHSDKQEFEKLNLGPLQAMPVVYEFFKFPMDEYIPEITSIDVIERLNGYLDSSNSWMKKIELDDFLEYLVAVYQVQTPFSLGVRIRSMPLAIQMLKKSKRDASQRRKGLLESLGITFTEDISKALERFRESILQTSKDSRPELKLHYSSLGPLEAIKEIYSKFEVLSVLMEGEGSPMLQHKMKKFHISFSSFKKSLEADTITRQLFHLAVCLSSTDVEESALAFLQEQNKPKQSEMPETTSGKPKKDRPQQGVVADKVITYINRCLQEGNLLLSHLRRIEEKVVESFGFPSFDELGHGAFLFFLYTNSKIKEILDDCGGAMIGSVSSATDGVRCFHPTYSDLKELVCQSKHAGTSQVQQLGTIVGEQFGVSEVKMLGHGSIARLCQAATSPGKHQSSQYNCHFEAALCGKTCLSMQGSHRVGRLGNQSREKAMAVLTSCPLLEDMGAWSHWTLVFQPEHGNLKEFVARHGGRQVLTISGGKQEATSDFMALETEPGTLLKISSQSTPASFNRALEQNDPLLAAGELASLIACSKGVESSPLALLANSVKAKLLSLRAQQGTSRFSATSDNVDSKVVFIVNMVMRLPLRICVAISNQVLLEPLNQVVGSAKSKVAIMQACHMPWQKERLETLGILLGIPEWTESLQYKMTFPSSLVQNLIADELFGNVGDGGYKQEEEKVPDSDSDDDEDDDIDSILSDEETKTQSMDKEDKEEGDINDSSEKIDDSKVVALSEEKDESETNSQEVHLEEKLDRVVETDKSDNVEDDEDEDEEGKQEEEDEEDVGKKIDESEEVEDEKKEENDTQIEGDEASSLKTTDKEVSKPLKREDICHQLIDSIRREEFGVGIQLTEEASKLMKTQQERQGRSLIRLSKDLYSKDTHFVLELIQNADDNPYADETLPALKFIIDNSGVTIQNNELGFEENNVRALCDVGKSTKSKHQLGYIGQKGIGFKSVFRVTDRPEVHSNGFHICFDVKSGPMGYIMPHWIEELPADNSWKTQILLPWTEAIKDQIQTHAARFNDIRPSLLLFLHRLREIVISNKVEGCEMRMTRKDFPTGEIQISHSHGVDRWLVVRKILDASDVSIEAKSGVEVLSTEIALAFPLRDKSNMMSCVARLSQLPVFAFLPLQSYGFRFIVQGDFNVPSSRESVDKDSSWNQWLRDRIPSLFLEAWDSFVNLPDFSDMEAFISYLQFIPLEGEVMGFFSPVTSLIRSQLMAKDCMPVVGTSGKKDEILWKTPSKTVMTQNSLVREIISPHLLLHNLGLYFLHWDVLEAVDHGVLQALGVNSISTEHLLQIGQGVAVHWDVAGSPGQVVELAKWMACIYCSLDLFKENTEIFSTLRKMRIVPLSDGSLVSMEDTTVFLLTDDQRPEQSHRKSKKTKPVKDPLQALRQDVNIIHPDLTSTPDPEVNSQVAKLLSRMDIKQMTPHDLIHGHVLPILNSDTWKEKSPEVLISYLVCAKQVLWDSPEDMSKLKGVARVVTNQGVKLPCQDNVHFPVDYGNEVNLKQIFPMLSWTMLDPAYLPQDASVAEKQSFHSFFSLLGVEDFLCVKNIQIPLDQTSLMNSRWASYKDLWQNLPEDFVVQDWSCEEFHSLINMADVHFETMCHLYRLLDKYWEKEYKAFMLTRLVSNTGEVVKQAVDTSFALDLKNSPWVPAVWATLTSETDFRVLSKQNGLLSPCDLYQNIPDVERLLSHTAKYLAVKTEMKSPFTQFLQIKRSVQKEAVKEALISWGQRSEVKPNIPAVFSTSIQHISTVYDFLTRSFPAGEIQNLFHEHPVIFIAAREGNMAIVSGQMMRREEMLWTDASGLFTKYRSSLEKYSNPLAKFKFMLPFYEDRQELFSIARIDKTYNMLHLAELLKHITAVYTLEDDGILHDILYLFSAIGQALSKADEMQAGVRTHEAQVTVTLIDKVKILLSECAIFPTKAKKLVGLKDQPMIADAKEWEKMFENKPSVHFLLLELLLTSKRRQYTPMHGKGRGAHQVSDEIEPEFIKCFVDLFAIKQLSSCVVWEEITSGFKPCHRGQRYLHDIVGVLQRFLYFLFPDAYVQFKSDAAHQLKELKFIEVNRLEVKYELKDVADVFELRTENCIIKGNHFYFLAKNSENQSEINKEVARFFGSGNEECIREIRNFLSQAASILRGKSDESLQDLLSRQRLPIDDLPEDEEVWEVPMPEMPTPVVNIPPEQGIAKYDTQGDSGLNPTPSGNLSQPGGPEEGEAAPMKSWPPQSIPDYAANPALLRTGGAKRPSKFAPPEAPDYIRASKQLPANFRFENRPEEKSTEKGEKRERGDKQSSKIPSDVKFVSDSEEEEDEEEEEESGSGKTEKVQKDKEAGSEERKVSSSKPSSSSAGLSKERTDRQMSREDDDSLVVTRGKRKLKSDNSSGEEGESRSPALKRQSLETNADEEIPPSDGTIPIENRSQTEGSRKEKTAGGAGDNRGEFMTSSDQGLVAVPRHVGGQGKPRDGSSDRDPRDKENRNRSYNKDHVLHFNIPVWNEQADNVAFTELTSDISKVTPTLRLEDNSQAMEIGRWGEMLVYDYLKGQKESNVSIEDIIWANSEEEKGLPYDFEMIFKTEDEDGDFYSVFIEVKTTRTDDRALFEISSNQVLFAIDKKERYQIFRVYGAGKDSLRMVRIDNIADRMKTKNVQLLMVI